MGELEPRMVQVCYLGSPPPDFIRCRHTLDSPHGCQTKSPRDAGWKHPREEDGLSRKGTSPSPNPG